MGDETGRRDIGQERLEMELGWETTTGEFDEGFLHCPEADEGEIGMGRLLDLEKFFIAHGILGDGLIVFSDRFDIHTDGLIGDHTDSGFLAVTQVEENLGMTDDGRLVVFAVFEDGQCGNAIDLT